MTTQRHRESGEVTQLEALRVDRGLSIEDVFKATGVAQKTITRYERALTARPTGDALERLAVFYGVRASVLLADMRRFAREKHGDPRARLAA